jgi:hypothetical protein
VSFTIADAHLYSHATTLFLQPATRRAHKLLGEPRFLEAYPADANGMITLTMANCDDPSGPLAALDNAGYRTTAWG